MDFQIYTSASTCFILPLILISDSCAQLECPFYWYLFPNTLRSVIVDFHLRSGKTTYWHPIYQALSWFVSIVDLHMRSVKTTLTPNLPSPLMVYIVCRCRPPSAKLKDHMLTQSIYQDLLSWFVLILTTSICKVDWAHWHHIY